MTFQVLLKKIFNIVILLAIVGMIFPIEATSISPHAEKTTVIYLIGFTGTGKYTIAKEIAKSDYKVVDNHLINNPIFSLIADDSISEASVLEKTNQIRNAVFAFMREDKKANYVLTNELLENSYHHNIYHNVQKIARQRDSIFVPVKLIISPKERAKRIIQPERKKQFKTTDLQEVYEARNMLHFSHENLLELDVTNLSAHEAAQCIMQHIERITSSR